MCAAGFGFKNAALDYVFQAEVSSSSTGRQTKDLLFVRYNGNSPLEAVDRDLDLSLRHHVFGRSPCQARQDNKKDAQCCYECNSVIQQACICPDFIPIIWDEDSTHHFQVNGLLTLWPPAELLPQKPYSHLGEA